MNRIAVLIDYSPESVTAIRHATLMARRSGAKLIGVHVSSRADDEELARLKTFLSEASASYEPVEAVLAEGGLLETIRDAVMASNPDVVFMCTHGIKGSQHFFGAHIVKLIQSLPFPCIVVQRNSVVKPEGYRRILVPASPFPGFDRKAEQSAAVARCFQSNVILYEIDKYLGNSADEVNANLNVAEDIYNREGVTHERVLDETSVMSMGYSRQTLQYAQAHQIDLICIMSEHTDSNIAILKADKESMLTNEFSIPVLACSH